MKIMHSNMKIWKLLTPAIALCFFAAAPQLAAQGSGSKSGYKGQGQQQQKEQYQHQRPAKQPKPSDFSEKEVEKFASAKGEVDQIQKEYADALSQVEDQQKARQLQRKYSQKMVESIRENGLSVQKYQKINMAAQNSQEFREKINRMAN